MASPSPACTPSSRPAADVARAAATAYFQLYNARDKTALRALFADDAEMLGLTVVVRGADAIVAGCAKLWVDGFVDGGTNSTAEEDGGVSPTCWYYPNFLQQNGQTVISVCEKENPEEHFLCYCEVTVQCGADEKPLRICDVIEVNGAGKILKITAYAGQRVEA